MFASSFFCTDNQVRLGTFEIAEGEIEVDLVAWLAESASATISAEVCPCFFTFDL